LDCFIDSVIDSHDYIQSFKNLFNAVPFIVYDVDLICDPITTTFDIQYFFTSIDVAKEYLKPNFLMAEVLIGGRIPAGIIQRVSSSQSSTRFSLRMPPQAWPSVSIKLFTPIPLFSKKAEFGPEWIIENFTCSVDLAGGCQ